MTHLSVRVPIWKKLRPMMRAAEPRENGNLVIRFAIGQEFVAIHANEISYVSAGDELVVFYTDRACMLCFDNEAVFGTRQFCMPNGRNEIVVNGAGQTLYGVLIDTGRTRDVPEERNHDRDYLVLETVHLRPNGITMDPKIEVREYAGLQISGALTIANAKFLSSPDRAGASED